MDVDPGKISSLSNVRFISHNLASDHLGPSKSVRLLSYAAVPGMLLSSRIYFKALSVIAKQQHTSGADVVIKEPAGLPDSASTTDSIGMKQDNPGTCLYFYSFQILFISPRPAWSIPSGTRARARRTRS
jgi:hypothetical protein